MRKSIKVMGVCLLFAQAIYASGLEVNPMHYADRFVENGIVKGIVLDSYGLPIAYASVEIFKGDQLIDGTLSEGDGTFLLSNVDFGEYTLKVTVVGMKPYTQKITISSKESNLGNITLSNDIIELEKTSVRGETSKITTQIDKRVIEVGKDLVSAGANAGDVLNNIPSLNVDQQSGELSLRGNSNVRVFLDGKPSSIPASELLKQLPSNSIEKVEIITNPSAKYDPEGNSGIINIITTKEKRKGYNVGLNAGYQHGRKNRYNGSINTNWNTGKLNLFANYSANFGQNNFYGGFDNQTTGLNQDLDLNSDNSSQLLKFGFDWFINNKNALTIYTNQSFRDSKMNINSTISQISNNSSFSDLSDTDSDNRNQDYSLNYKKDFEAEGHSIELDAFYSISNGKEGSEFDWSSTLLNLADTSLEDKLRFYGQNKNQDITNTRVKLDYTLPFKEKGTIEAGLNFNQEGTESTLITSQFLPEYNNGQTIDALEAQDTYFDFTRNIFAGYLNAKYQFGKLGAQVGLRAEQVDLDADVQLYGSNDFNDENSNVKRNDINFYPSVFLTYKATQADEFSLNYSRRVDRPSIWSLSPIRNWQTATSRQEGNPDLKPQFTDSYELGYMHTIGRKGTVNASVMYRLTHDQMNQFMIVDEANPNITVIKNNNVDEISSYGAEVSWFYKATNWWNLNGGLDVYKSTIKSKFAQSNQDLEVDVTNFTGRLSNDFTLTNSLKLQLFTLYMAPEDNLQGTREAMFRQDIGLRKSFLNNQLNLTARYSDIFNTFYAKLDYIYPQNQVGEFHWESQVFYLGLSYNFGGKVKTRAGKQQNQSEMGNQGIGL